MVAVPMVMKQMHERAQQEQNVGQGALNVHPMLGEQEIARDEGKAHKDPFPKTGNNTAMMLVGFHLALAIPTRLPEVKGTRDQALARPSAFIRSSQRLALAALSCPVMPITVSLTGAMPTKPRILRFIDLMLCARKYHL